MFKVITSNFYDSAFNDVLKFGLIYSGIQIERLCIAQGVSPCSFINEYKLLKTRV
jgi:hypothetical protein